MSESLPLATIQEAVLEFLRGRDDAVFFTSEKVPILLTKKYPH